MVVADENEEGGTAVDGDCAGDGGGAVVVVGVKMDLQSKELLTWALVKVAQSGDRVIAVHVITTPAESKSSLLSLVKTFDSVLAVYEGFCNLKQVDLKLKVCRGSSVKKVLAQEAKSYEAAKVVVGSSKTRHTIRSQVSVAKYCARKLSKNFSVYAIGNGKIAFQREATTRKVYHSEETDDKGLTNYCLLHPQLCENVKESSDKNYGLVLDKVDIECQHCLSKSCSDCEDGVQKNTCRICSSESVWSDSSGMQKEFIGNDNVDNSLALVPYQAPEVVLSPTETVAESSPGSRWRWARFHRILKWRHSEKSSEKKTSMTQSVTGLPAKQSSALVYPNGKESPFEQDEEYCTELDGNDKAIVSGGLDGSCPHLLSYNEVKRLPQELEGLHEKYSAVCRLFTYQELSAATSDFIPENMVGKGGSSHVYRGCLSDGKELAVKILKPSEEVLKEFASEIEIITTLNHKNIISLFGFCYEDSKLLLVYDYSSRGSLEENLHGDHKDGNSFSWQERQKVAVGVVEALDYLHNGCTEPVIHRDVKSSNILLSDDFEPQLSDFGLANWASKVSSHISCGDVAGTFGYLAPEYFMHGKVSEKIDVYAFGVVLLELLSGRKPIDSKQPKGQESLVMWAKPILKSGKISQLIDPGLGSNYDHDEAERMALAASLCIGRSPRLRPQINLVLKLLQGDEEATKCARQQVETLDEVDIMDGEVPNANIQSHLNVVLQDLDGDSFSIGSTVQSLSVEDYLHGRWSRWPSFD